MTKTVGLPISTKENEKRRALFPNHVSLLKNKTNLYFQTGYGQHFGYSDEDYLNAGAHVTTIDKVLQQDIICDPKIGDATYLPHLTPCQTIFGWIHAVRNKHITDQIVAKQLTAYAWEDMFECGRHVFWRSNEIAGEAAILHAFTLYGKLPNECRVALIGRGNVARGAHKMLSCLGAKVNVFGRDGEALFIKELASFDVVVNAVLWDIKREDHILYRKHLSRMKRPSMVIDISCDKAGAIETSIPTTIDNPVYTIDGVLHYVVDHTPALLGYSVTSTLGDELIKYIDVLMEDKAENSGVLEKAACIKNGKVIDQRINEYQNRPS